MPNQDPNADGELDQLMARVRQAAARADLTAQSPVQEVAPTLEGSVHALVQVVAAQTDWNSRTTQSLATVAECLRDLQDAVIELRARERRTDTSTQPRKRAPKVGRRQR
jgi:hypothetical protein